MRAVVQRVAGASVRVADSLVARIDDGLLVLLGVIDGDTDDDAAAMAAKVTDLRIFGDDQGRMNRSVLDIGGQVLVVSQFTLAADVRRGRRPSFTSAASPETAAPVIEAFGAALEAHGIPVASGVFGAMMEVASVNSGPVTIVIDVRDGRVV